MPLIKNSIVLTISSLYYYTLQGNTSQIDELVKEFKSSPPKILIGTPKNLLEIVKHNEDMFKSTVRLVLDEVDKMLPPIIPAEKKQVRNRIRHPKPLEHLVPLITEVSQVGRPP